MIYCHFCCDKNMQNSLVVINKVQENYKATGITKNTSSYSKLLCFHKTLKDLWTLTMTVASCSCKITKSTNICLLILPLYQISNYFDRCKNSWNETVNIFFKIILCLAFTYLQRLAWGCKIYQNDEYVDRLDV